MPPYTRPINGNCPALCNADRQCSSKDQIYCPMNDPNNGCELKGSCMEIPKGKDGNSCPPHGACPVICPPGNQMCPVPADDNVSYYYFSLTGRGQLAQGKRVACDCRPTGLLWDERVSVD